MKNSKKTPAIVVSDNDFIKNSGYRLTSQGNLFLLWIISQIKKGDKCERVYEITIKDFMERTGIKDKNIYKEIRKITQTLLQQCLVVNYKEEEVYKKKIIPWLSYVEFSSNGLISFKFNPFLKPYLFDLEKNYTSTDYEQCLKLNTFGSQRFYQVFKTEGYKNNGSTMEMEVDYLKFLLQIDNDEYDSYGHLKNRVINPSIKKINEKTDLLVTYKEKKIGRKVDSLEFNIKNKSISSSAQDQEILSSPLYGELLAIGISKRGATLILKEYDNPTLRHGIEIVKKYRDQIESTPLAYLKVVLKNHKQELERQSEMGTVKSPSPEELDLPFEGEFNECLKTLADSITHSSYKSWFSDVTFELVGDVLYVVCPSPFKVEKVLPYEESIKKAWNSSGYNVDTVKIFARE